MPPIPKQISRRVLPSGRVGDVFIPSDIADVGADIEARGLGALGRGVSNLGQALGQIKLVEGESQANTSFIQADSKMQVFLENLRNNNNPDSYESEKEKLFDSFNEIEPISNIGKRLFNERIKLSKLQWDSTVKIAELRKRQKLIEEAAIANYQIEIGKGNLAGALTITESDFGIGAITKAERNKRLVEAPGLVNKILIGNAIQIIKDSAVRNPQLVKDAVTLEISRREKGQKPSDDFVLLSDTDLEKIRDYTNTIGEKQKTQSEINVDIAILDAYGRIRNGETDIDSLIDAIDSDTTISVEDKIRAAKDIPTYFNKINSIKSVDVSGDDAYDELTQASESVERGALSPAAFEKLYAEKKELLDSEDQRLIRSKDIVATRTMQNRTFSDALIVTRPTLIEVTEDELSALLLARKNAELIQDLQKVNIFNIAIKKNQAQRWNFGRFRKQLREQINQNPEWSQKQIFVAQEILTSQLDLPDDELLKQFDNQNPDRAILKTPPDDKFQNIWNDFSIEDKAKIWELSMRGVSADVILREIP